MKKSKTSQSVQNIKNQPNKQTIVKEIFCSIQINPYGILGFKNIIENTNRKPITHDEFVKGMEPKSNMALVDPAGFYNITSKSHNGASGASGSIYKWLHTNGIENQFPVDVTNAIKYDCDSKQHRYTFNNGNKITIIHTVGPDFTQTIHKSSYLYEDVDYPINKLYLAYTNTFIQFIDSLSDLRKSGTPTLRLLPISGGIFAGSYSDDIPQITMKSLFKGLQQLNNNQLNKLKGTKIEMCIYESGNEILYELEFNKMCESNSPLSLNAPLPLNSPLPLKAPLPLNAPSNNLIELWKTTTRSLENNRNNRPTNNFHNTKKHWFISNNNANKYLKPFGLTKNNRNKTWNTIKNQYSYWLPENKDPFKYISNQFTRKNGKYFYNDLSNYVWPKTKQQHL
jgi:hypothetical protein